MFDTRDVFGSFHLCRHPVRPHSRTRRQHETVYDTTGSDKHLTDHRTNTRAGGQAYWSGTCSAKTAIIPVLEASCTSPVGGSLLRRREGWRSCLPELLLPTPGPWEATTQILPKDTEAKYKAQDSPSNCFFDVAGITALFCSFGEVVRLREVAPFGKNHALHWPERVRRTVTTLVR